MRRLIDKVTGRKRQPVALTRAQATAARPIRNPALAYHKNDEGYVVVTLPRRQDLTGKALSWVFMVPESRPIVLDEIGTMMWELCDGKHSFSDMAGALAQHYSVTAREAEVSLAEFLRRLGKRGMIAFTLPKDIAETLTEEQREVLGVVEIEAEPEPRRRSPKRKRGEEETTEAEEEQEERRVPLWLLPFQGLAGLFGGGGKEEPPEEEE
jgi:hypothetical protein